MDPVRGGMTKGSHVTWENYPRVCSGCGQKLRIKKDQIWFEARDIKGRTERRSWHIDCRPIQRRKPHWLGETEVAWERANEVRDQRQQEWQEDEYHRLNGTVEQPIREEARHD